MRKSKRKQNHHPLWWDPKREGPYRRKCAGIVNAALEVDTLEALEDADHRLCRMLLNGTAKEIGCPTPGTTGPDDGMRILHEAMEMLEPKGQLPLLDHLCTSVTE